MTEGEEQRLPILAGWPKEPLLVVFFIPLPRSLAIPDGSMFMFRRRGVLPWPRYYWPQTNATLPGKNYVVLKVHRVTEELTPNVKPLDQALRVALSVTHSDPGVMHPADMPPYQSKATVIEAATPLVPTMRTAGTLDVDKSIDDSFDAIMDTLGDLTRAYLAAGGISSVPVPTRHSLFTFLPFTTRSPVETAEEHRGEREAQRAAWGALGIYRPTDQVDRYIPRDVHELSPAEFKKMLTMLTRLDEGDPFGLYTQRARACQRAIYIEPDYVTASIEAQLASEFLLDALLLVLAWEENVTPEDAANWFMESLTRRIRRHYRSRLGGSWEPRHGRTVLGRWARRTRDLRNMVAHSGHRPAESEVVASLQAFGLLEAYVKNRLSARRNRYPRTTLLLLGTPGLEGRGLFLGEIKRFAETVADNEPSWFKSFSAWARKFERAREQLFS